MRSPARATWSRTPGSHQRWKVSTTTPDRLDRELLGDVEGLAQRRDDAAVGREDRVHRLDAEPDAGGERGGHQLADRLGGAVPGRDQVTVALGQAAGDQYQGGRPECRGTPRSPGGSRRGRGPGPSASTTVKNPPRQTEETRRPASRSQVTAVSRPTSATGSRQTPMLESPAARQPSIASRRSHAAVVRWLSESRARRGSPGAGVADPGRPGGGYVEHAGHRVSPATSSQARIRDAARSGSRSRPASPASSSTRPRCTALRADCSPPTMVKPRWCPFSQARKAIPVL